MSERQQHPITSSRTPLNTPEAAREIGLSPSKLEKLRAADEGPPYRRHGRRVVYLREELWAWSDSHKVEPRQHESAL